jgi:hypothetical protein
MAPEANAGAAMMRIRLVNGEFFASTELSIGRCSRRDTISHLELAVRLRGERPGSSSLLPRQLRGSTKAEWHL